MQPSAIDEDLETLGLSELPLVVAELQGLKIVGVSSSVAGALELPPSKILGRAIPEFVREEDQQKAVQGMAALRDGVVDFYRAGRIIRTAPGQRNLDVVWTRAVEFDHQRLALIELGGEDGPLTNVRSVLQQDTPEMVVGVTDESWVIASVSSETDDALGAAPMSVIGRRLPDLFKPEHAERLVRAEQMLSEHGVVSLVAHISSEFQGWGSVCCVLAHWSPARPQVGFLLVREGELTRSPEERANKLARHLLNIAAEVDASGILQRIGPLPDLTREPKMRLLSTRQWDIVHRLLQGQRVPAIARELFISQSTVRNHLAQVFERFGVHSQSELLDYLHRLER